MFRGTYAIPNLGILLFFHIGGSPRREGTVQEASDVTGLFVRVEESSRTAKSLGTVLAEHLLDG